MVALIKVYMHAFLHIIYINTLLGNKIPVYVGNVSLLSDVSGIRAAKS